METVVKDYYIQLDTKYKITGESIKLVQADNNGNVFHLTLTENDGPINLTGATVSITLLKADGKVLVNYCNITDALNGKCDYTVDAQALTYVGQVVYSVEIYANGGRVTTNQAKFKVVAQLDDGSAAPSDGNYNILATLIEEVNATENNIIDNETIRQDNEDTRQANEATRISNENTRIANEDVRISNETTRVTEFAQIKEDYNTASKYTVVSSLEGSYIASEDNTMTFILPIGVFNPLVDVVRLFYKGAFLSENLHYSRLGSEITLGFVIQTGEQIDFQIDKAVINEIPGADGGLLMEKSVKQMSLSEDVQAKLNYAGVKTIDGKFTATVDNTTVFTITEDYNPTMNVLRLYYEGCYLEKGISYTQIGSQITLTFPINTGEEINYQIERNVSVEVPQSDGSNLMNDSVGITKLTEDVREKVNEVPGILKNLEEKILIVSVKSFGAKGDGITDDTQAIQNAINSAGTGGVVIFEKRKEYKVSSTIFVPVGIVLEFNFCTITPTSGTYVNNYVFSLNSSNVSTWNEQYPFKFVEIKHLVSDNSNLITDLKLFFVACPIRTKDIYSRRYYGTIKTGSLYIDLFDVKYVMVVDHMSNVNYSIEKVGQGDAVSIKGIHCVNYLSEAYLKGVSISGSLGCTIDNCLNGDYKINNCESVSINNSHFEKGIITLQDSNVEINNCYFWKKPNTSCITITDSQLAYSGQINRPIIFNNVVFKLKYQMYSYGVDYEEIDISSFGGEVILNNVYREAESYGMPYAYAYNCGIALKTGTGTFILTNSNIATIRNKAIKNDKIINGATDDGYYYMSNGSPYENSNITFKGSLATYYYKVASILDKSRMIGVVNNANEKSISITNLNSYAKLVFGSSVIYLPMIRIYRGTSPGIYNKYVDIPYPMSKSLLDTGEDINGFSWKDNVSGTYNALNTSYSFQFNGNNITSYGTGIPTVGTWVKGDRIINVNATVGQPKSWVCTVAGTPGTFVSEGNL